MSEEQKTHLANSIEVADAKSKMDENAKQLLANKQVLSWILKHTVEKFRDYTYEEIEGCIEGEPEIGTHPVHPGKRKAEAITGMNTESKIHFKCRSTKIVSFNISLDIARTVLLC